MFVFEDVCPCDVVRTHCLHQLQPLQLLPQLMRFLCCQQDIVLYQLKNEWFVSVFKRPFPDLQLNLVVDGANL